MLEEGRNRKRCMGGGKGTETHSARGQVGHQAAGPATRQARRYCSVAARDLRGDSRPPLNPGLSTPLLGDSSPLSALASTTGGRAAPPLAAPALLPAGRAGDGAAGGASRALRAAPRPSL